MRALKVDMDGITEFEMPDDFDCTRALGWDWDHVELGNGHDAWVRDDALFQPSVAVATFGGRENVPLPAYVLGVDGARTTSATMSMDELGVLVTARTRVR